jgi:hypothetical protein
MNTFAEGNNIERMPFSYDRESGIKTVFCYNHDTDEQFFEKSQDSEPILEFNKAQQLQTADHWRGEMHKVASIPLHIYMDLKKQGIIDDPTRFKAWLNDRDNQAFRTRMGRV